METQKQHPNWASAALAAIVSGFFSALVYALCPKDQLCEPCVFARFVFLNLLGGLALWVLDRWTKK